MYYYSPNKLDPDYSNLEKIQKRIKEKALPYLPKIQDLYPSLKINLLWTQKNTFGYVFADFEKRYKGRTIGRGESYLFNQLRDKYVCIVLSDKIPDKYSEEENIDVGKILRINFLRFRNLLSMFGSTKDVVLSFLEEAFPSVGEFEELKERIEKGTAISDKDRLERLLQVVENYPEKNISDLNLLVDKLSFLPKKLKLSSTQISKLVKFVDDYSQRDDFKFDDFEKFNQIKLKTEFAEEDATEMIGMLDRFSKNYRLKNRDDLEKVLNSTINLLEENDLTKPTDFKNFLGAVEKISSHYKITNMEDFEKIMELCKISEDILKSNYTYFQEKLAEYKVMIDDDITSERQIQDFITEHRWILDFKFWSYDKVENEKSIENIGRIDLYMAKKQFKFSNIAIVEFKKPDFTVTDERYRINKPVLTKGAVSALNQTMHYIENIKKESYDIVEGLVIVGRKSKESDYFVEVFNKYLTKEISTMTFQDLYKKAKEIVDAFVITN